MWLTAVIAYECEHNNSFDWNCVCTQNKARLMQRATIGNYACFHEMPYLLSSFCRRRRRCHRHCHYCRCRCRWQQHFNSGISLLPYKCATLFIEWMHRNCAGDFTHLCDRRWWIHQRIGWTNYRWHMMAGAQHRTSRYQHGGGCVWYVWRTEITVRTRRRCIWSIAWLEYFLFSKKEKEKNCKINTHEFKFISRTFNMNASKLSNECQSMSHQFNTFSVLCLCLCLISDFRFSVISTWTTAYFCIQICSWVSSMDALLSCGRMYSRPDDEFSMCFLCEVNDVNHGDMRQQGKS